MGVLGYVKDLPFGEMKRALHFIRRQYFSREAPNPDSLLINEDAEWLSGYLKENYHFEQVDKYSFHFDGEVVNIRAPWGLDYRDIEDADQQQLELHIRMFELDGDEWDTVVMVHLERSRFQHWAEHINSIGMSWGDGISNTTPILDELGIDYEKMRAAEAYQKYHNGEIPDEFRE